MSRNGSEKVKEIEDDLGSSVRVCANGNEGRKGVAGKARVYDGQSGRLWAPHPHTLLADSEQFISFPGDNSPRESAPAPFHHTAEDLYARPVSDNSWVGNTKNSHHGVREPQLLQQIISIDRRAFLEGIIEIIADKGARCTGVGAWTERQEEERGIEACEPHGDQQHEQCARFRISMQATSMCKHTSSFQFLGTTSQQGLDFIGSNLRTQPGIGP